MQTRGGLGPIHVGAMTRLFGRWHFAGRLTRAEVESARVGRRGRAVYHFEARHSPGVGGWGVLQVSDGGIRRHR